MKSTRRDLIKKAALGGTTLAAANILAACSKTEKTAEKAVEAVTEKVAELTYVSADNSTAKALGYVEDASTMAADARPDKGDTKGSDQLCNNCQFYTAKEGTEGGKCSLFPGKLVKDGAWCRSWSLKAQA